MGGKEARPCGMEGRVSVSPPGQMLLQLGSWWKEVEKDDCGKRWKRVTSSFRHRVLKDPIMSPCFNQEQYSLFQETVCIYGRKIVLFPFSPIFMEPAEPERKYTVGPTPQLAIRIGCVLAL